MEKEEEKTQDEMINELVDKIVQNKEIKNIFDAQEILKKSFGKVIEGMLEAEISTQLGHKKYEYTEKPKTNYRNGHSKKTVKSSMGEIELDIPRDRNNEYEPIVLPKNSRNISDLETQFKLILRRIYHLASIDDHLNDIGYIVSNLEMQETEYLV